MNANQVRQELTAKIVAALEQNTIPWRRPWNTSPNAGRPANCQSRNCYSGINPLLLELHAQKFGFRSRFWGTFDQWKKLGCTVQRRPEGVEAGDWGCKIVFYKPYLKSLVDHETGKEKQLHRSVLRTWWVFNAQQLEGEGIEKYLVDHSSEIGSEPPIFEPAEELIAATACEIHHDGDRAFYCPPVGIWPNHIGGDFIGMPMKSRFDRLGSYYETLLHELAHWSEVRLGWEGTYAMGELIAEMSGCFLASELGVPQGEDISNHAAYLQHWLEAMKEDASFIFKASTQASKVTEFLLSFVRSHQPGELEIEHGATA